MSHLTPEPRPQTVLTLSSEALVRCPGCGSPFAPRRPNHKYCGAKCRMLAFHGKQGADRRERDAKVRLKLREAQHAVNEALEVLEKPE